MTKTYRIALALVLVVLLGTALGPRSVQAATFTVARWNPIEITLTSNVAYTNPYKDVDVNATFSGPGGITMTMPGFWDGGNSWKVRFSPTVVGSWSYTTSSTDPSNTGLNNQTGTITCTAYSGTLPIYQHGFLKPSSNNRYLTYADDTPFYWLGDTHWSGFSSAERLNQSNDSRWTSMFKGMVDRRVAQGFTVWKGETFANNNEAGNPPTNEGGNAWGSGGFFNDLNPSFWQNIDQRIQYLASKGMVISMAQGIGRSMTSAAGETDHKRLARYILARYGAYPTVWVTAQEYNDFGACGACWANVASYVYSLDPYQRANSMHNGPGNPIAYHDQAWYGFVTLQQAHNRVDAVDHWLSQYNATPARPVLEDEANYEDIIPSYGGGSATPKWKTRQSAWQSQIGGAFGFTYGAQGIWWGCYTTSDPNGNCGSGSDARAWNTAIDFPVGQQMSSMQAFWTSFSWWTLAPDSAAIVWNGAPSGTQRPFQKSDGTNRGLIVAYLPLQSGGSAYTGTVNNLSPTGVYQARWFNPSTGSYTTISASFTPSAAGQWSLPAQPTAADDWVLLIQRTGGSNTAPNAPTNLALNKAYSSSSNWDANQTADKAFDSNLNTDWQAGNSTSSGSGFNNSWLAVDFGAATTFNSVTLTEYNNRTTGFRIEYWNGASWQTAYTGTSIGATGVPRTLSFSAVTGSKARVLFTSGTEFSPIIYEFGVYAPQSTSLVTAVSAQGTVRNDATSANGMKITVGSSARTVTALGRFFISGNSGTHTLRIVRASDNVEIANVSVNMASGSADALGFKYAALSTPATLAANTAYYVVSQETTGGDQWYDNINTSLTTSGAATINGSVYSNGSSWVVNGSGGTSYGPVNLLYQ